MSTVADVLRRPSVFIETPSGVSRPSDKGGGERGGDPDPEIGGGLKKFFPPFGPHFGLKVRGVGPPGPSPDPPLTP